MCAEVGHDFEEGVVVVACLIPNIITSIINPTLAGPYIVEPSQLRALDVVTFGYGEAEKLAEVAILIFPSGQFSVMLQQPLLSSWITALSRGAFLTLTH